MTKRGMTCTCCGDDAGRWEQHWNQDNGFSVCPKCLEWITGREYLSAESIRFNYGEAGVNHGGPA